MTIREIIADIIRSEMNLEHIYSVECEVIDVDEADRTCEVRRISTGVEIRDVRLQASVSNDVGFVLIPSISSRVIVTFLNNNTAFLSQAEKITKVLLDVDSDIGEIIINGGDNGGVVIASELKEQVDKNTAILDAIKNILSGAPIPESGNGLPSALQTALNSATSLLQTADLSNIENDKFKH